MDESRSTPRSARRPSVHAAALRLRRAALGGCLGALAAACGADAAAELQLPDAGGSVVVDGGAVADAASGNPTPAQDAAIRSTDDASMLDAAPPAVRFTDGGSGCMLGAAGSFATDESLDLFGETVYFAMGQDLPAGRYRVTYRDGCMKYNNLFPWTVNSNGGADGWWLVGDSPDERLFVLPGAAAAHPLDGHLDFEACVQAGRALDPVEFDFEGGRLGIWLNDAPYQDNQAGEGGRNPAWDLTLLLEECPPDLVLI